MPSYRTTLFAFIAGLALTGAAPAQTSDAQVADFEDVPTLQTGFVLPTRDGFAYDGLIWTGFYVINSDHGLTKQFPRSGYRTGKVSGRYACVGSLRSAAHSEIHTQSGGRFDILSLYLTSAWRNGLLVRLEGLQDGKPIAHKDLTLQGGERQRLELGFEDLDSLRISAAGGEDAGLCEGPSCSSGPEVVFDDIVFRIRPQQKPEPEPPVEISEVRPSEAPAPLPAPEPPAPAQPEPPPKAEAPPRPKARPAKTAKPAKPTPAPAPAAPPAPDDASIARRMENQIAAGVCGSKPYYGAQIGAFGSKKNALSIAAKLRAQDMLVQIHEKTRGDQGPLFFVIAGCFEEKSHAAVLAKSLREDGLKSFVTRSSIRSLGPLVQE